MIRRVARRRLLLVLCAAALGLCAGGRPARAAIQEQKSAYLFRVFSDVKDVRVLSNYASYDLRLMNQAKLRMQWNHEVVVVAGVSAPPGSPEAVDAITTASRPIARTANAFEDYTKVRNELTADVGLRQVTAGYYISSESDYLAQLVKAGWSRSLIDNNLTLGVSSSFGWDAISPLPDDNVPGQPARVLPNDRRRSWDWNASATQVLSTTTLLHVGAELNEVRGLQHNPYRNVYAGGAPRPEVHPEERSRRDFYVDLDQFLLNRSSVTLSYRYYNDDWGVSSNTLAARVTQYISDDVTVEYRYRWYDQGAADFFRTEYASADGVDGYRTGDYRLSDFTAHLFGARLQMNLAAVGHRQPLLTHFDWSVKYERYFNTNNFSADLLESGLVYRF